MSKTHPSSPEGEEWSHSPFDFFLSKNDKKLSITNQTITCNKKPLRVDSLHNKNIPILGIYFDQLHRLFLAISLAFLYTFG